MQDPREKYPKPPFQQGLQRSPGFESEMSTHPDFGERSYRGSGRLMDQVALITGADSGIGRAVALAFAREGAHVAVSYLSEHEDAQETKRVVEESGRKAILLPGDIADDRHCAAVVDSTVTSFGRLDILVNNAAYQAEALESLDELKDERVRRTFAVNIIAMFSFVHYTLPHMGAGSRIINTASIQAYKPSPSIIDYAATKGAIVSFTKALAQILTPAGIRVNAVAPGPVWTPIIPQSFKKEKVENFGKDSLLGRPAQPAELAPAYVFLASEESSYISGEVLGVTGGKLLP